MEDSGLQGGHPTVSKNQRLQCCVCRANDAWMSSDYVVLRVTYPTSPDDSFQLLGAHQHCLNGFMNNIVDIVDH